MSSFLFKCDFFDTLTSLATLKSKHIAALFEAVAIKMKRTLGTLSQHVLSLSSTECSFFFFSQMHQIKNNRGKNKNPISAYYDLVFPHSMLRSQCAISDPISYSLSLQTHLWESKCDQSERRAAAPRDSADAPLRFPLNIKG